MRVGPSIPFDFLLSICNSEAIRDKTLTQKIETHILEK